MSTEMLRRLLNQGPGSVPLKDLIGATTHERSEFLKISKELANRSCEALRLYSPLAFQQKFHECTAKECICLKGNRAGGSVAGFVEDARAVTGRDPLKKYPPRDGTCVCLGFGEKHIGRVIHKFLFRAGAFRIIRDEETREWRVYRPWPKDQGGDQERESEAKPCPPLIPPRMIAEDGMVWERRGDRVFSVCRLTTGWEIFALNSAGDPSQAQGFDVNLYHIDEDTANVGWYEEAIGRTAIPKGLIRWTALPHSRNDDILNMMQRAEDEMNEGVENPTTVCIRASMFDNPYYPEESRQANIKIWSAQGEEVLRKRAYGELVVDSLLVYPTFSKFIHTTAIEDDEKANPALRAYRDNGGNPPEDWCLSFACDPGHTIFAGLCLATPPPSLGDFRIVFDEMYIRQCDAERFGVEAEKRMRQRAFERFIIDAHGGRLTDFGSGIRPQKLYEMQLKQRNLKCHSTGSYFIAGSDDIEGREQVVREWLRVRQDGSAKLYIDVNRCPNLTREMERFKKKQQKVGGNMIVLDEANRKSACHAIECLEYLAAHGCEYVRPPKPRVVNTWVKQVMRDRDTRARKRRMRSPSAGRQSIVLAPRGDS